MTPDDHKNADDFQQAWQAHSSQTRVTINPDLLLKEVQRNQREFRTLILVRDFREIGIALLLIPLWLFLGITFALPWTWYLEIPACIFMVAFFLVDRVRHPQSPPVPGEPLLVNVKESLTQVEHQIWLLRNVLWWYIMPAAIPVFLFFTHVALLTSRSWWEALGYATPLFVFALAIYLFVYYINQYAVRNQLEPRRQELLGLLADITDETTSEVSGEYTILTDSAYAKVQKSISGVESRIGLFRKYIHWCLLPVAIVLSVFFLYEAWFSSASWSGFLSLWLAAELYLALVCISIHYFFRFIVRKHLEPRRQQLLALRAGLTDETTSELSDEYTKIMGAEQTKWSSRLLLDAGVGFLFFLSIGIGGIYFGYKLDQEYPKNSPLLEQGYPKKSPFAAVRWQQSQPEVKVDDEWLRLVLLNNIPTSEIVAYSQETYKDLWQKRFEEDLVELLTRMGHPPQDTVTLTVQSLTTAEVWTLRDVPMTRANRRAIRDAAQTLDPAEQ